MDSPLKFLRGFERDEFTKVFSTQSLGTLTQRGIICAPTAGLRNWIKPPHKTVLHSPDLVCFPWAVVEFKREAQASSVSAEERCYCQAANASAAALDLRTQLFTRAFNDAGSNLPPVIAFTCVGHIVRVWLTYLAEPDHSKTRVRRMVCIWITSVQLTWGVATLRAIITNMHTWASRILKPKIQACAVQALKIPYKRPEQKSTAPDMDLASSGIFNSPLFDTRAISKLTPLNRTFAPLLNEDSSPSGSRESQFEVTSQPASPLSLQVDRPQRRKAIPRTRHLSTNFTTKHLTPRLVPTHAASSDIRASTGTEQHTTVPVTLSTGDCTKKKGLDEQVNMDQITKSLESSHLDDSIAKTGTQHHGPEKELGRSLKDGKCDNQTPNSSSGFGKEIEIDPVSHSASQNVGASPQSSHPPIFPEIPAAVPSVLSSSSVSNASLHAGVHRLGIFSQFQVPRFEFLFKSAAPLQAENHRPNASASKSTSPPPENNFSKKISASAEADIFEITEIFASSSLRSSNKDQRCCCGESPRIKTRGKKLGDGSDHDSGEEARLDADDAKHALGADTSKSSNCTSSEIDTPDMEVTNRPEDESDSQSDCESRTEAACEDSLNVSDLEPEDQSDGNNGYESSSEYENNDRKSRCESRCQNDSEESGRDSDSEDQDKSGRQSDLEPEDYSESDESGTDSDLVLDSEDGSYSTSRSAGNVTEDDLGWMVGLGSLNGHQLAQASYLRLLFMSRKPYKQVSMIRDVLGAGAMVDDRYRYAEGDLLDDLLEDLNALFPSGHGIGRRAFQRQQADRKIREALHEMAHQYVTDQFRWHCFRKTLALRSRGVCRDLLCSRSFNFSEDEWARLEDSAKLAVSAYYSPIGVRLLLEGNLFTE